MVCWLTRRVCSNDVAGPQPERGAFHPVRIPDDPPASPPSASRAADLVARNDADGARLHPAAVRPARAGRQEGNRARCRATTSSASTASSTRSAPPRDLGVRAFILFGIPDAQGRDRLAAPATTTASSSRRCGRCERHYERRACSSPTSASASTPTTATAASLQRARRPARRGQRRDAAAPGRAVRQPRAGRGRRGRPERHDGRHGRRDPHGPRRRRLRARCRS